MAYFALTDDVDIPSRWHLGDIRLADGAEVDARTACPLALAGSVDVAVGVAGRSLDFCLTSFAMPVSTAKLARAIAEVAGADVEAIRARVGGKGDYAILNATRQIRCLDESRSSFTKWTEQDHRADLAGNYRMVVDLRVDQTAVPTDAHFFRIERRRIALIVSGAVKAAMESAGCFGARFEQV